MRVVRHAPRTAPFIHSFTRKLLSVHADLAVAHTQKMFDAFLQAKLHAEAAAVAEDADEEVFEEEGMEAKQPRNRNARVFLALRRRDK